MSWGIKLAKAGYDYTETDPRNLIFDSSLNHLKTAGYDDISETVASGATTTVTVAHGLGYMPMVIGYFRDTSTSNWFITMSQPVAITTLKRSLTKLNVVVAVDTTNIYLTFINADSSSKTIELKYEFFYEGI